MTIKDVEKLTGLTAKSIRYYEQKGLLTVERNEENDYRNYTEAEVNRLKRIKLFRYLDFTVEEIKKLLESDREEVQKSLRQKAEEFSTQRERCRDKQEWCLSLEKDYKQNEETLDKIVSGYNEAMDFLESDEMAEIEEDLLDASMPSFSLTLIMSLIPLGPILWLLIHIGEGNVEGLMLNAVLAVAATILLTLLWVHYVYKCVKYKDRVKKKNRTNRWVIPGTIVLIVVGIALMTWLIGGVTSLLAADDYYFLEYGEMTKNLLAWFVMVPLLLVMMLLIAKVSKKTQKEMDKMGDLLYLWNRLGKWKWLVIGIWLLGLYCCLTSMTVVTPDHIICHSPIHPTGVSYNYSDVESIRVGFGQEVITFDDWNRKGEFYYQIVLDGKTITFYAEHYNEEIERYREDTYLWYEEFDQALVDLGISKTADATGYENCDIAQQYLDRYLRIIENQ